MSAEAALHEVIAWFTRVESASVEFPNGWFGRPYDNAHRLTWSVVRDGKLFLELDGQLHLILADVQLHDGGADDLEARCSQVVFDRRDYGSSGERHVEVFRNGASVRFHASRSRI